MTVTHKVFEQLTEEWDTFFSTSHPLHSRELGITQDSALTHLSYYYVITSVDGEPALLSYYQHLAVTPEHFNCRDKVFQHYSLNFSLRMVKPTLLVAGNLFRHDVPFLFFTNKLSNVEERAALYKQTFEYVLDYSKATGIFLKDVAPENEAAIRADISYHPMPDDVSMALYVPSHWNSLKDYEEALKHKYLQRYRKIRKQLDGVAIRELSQDEVFTYKQDIESLYLQVTNRQLVSMGKINDAFFVHMKEQFGDRYKVFGWFYEGRMVAFSSAILHDGIYDMNYIGFDYALNQSHSMYFNILFHCLEQSILSRSRKLVLGRTALEAKAIIGCEPEYQYSFYKLRHVVVNWFYKKVSAGFREQIGEKWKDRHPFKSSFYSEGNAKK